MEHSPEPAQQTESTAGKVKLAPQHDPHRVYFSALNNAQKAALEQARKISATAITLQQLDTENEVLSWSQYLERTLERPGTIRYSAQRIHDMIVREGVEPAVHDDGSPMITPYGHRISRYPFFSKRGIAGTEEALDELVRALDEAAHGDETKFRFFLLKGPVGTAKSTIINIMKKGLEEYSRTDEGALYALEWDNLPEAVAKDLKMDPDPKTGTYRYIEPMHDDPLRVIPETVIVKDGGREKKVHPRAELTGIINEEFKRQNGDVLPYELQVDGELSPASALIRKSLLEHYAKEIKAGHLTLKPGQDILDLVLEKHVKAARFILSEGQRQGIGSYTPKDAKNQDSTELNGDIDYSKLPMYGDPSHPLAQAYRGEFNIANRGIMDFEEMLKLQREFLYDVLHAAQERTAKPKNGATLTLDLVVVGKTNMEEADEKGLDDKMKAFWNRAIEIPVKYLMSRRSESSIYETKLQRSAKKRGYAVAPYCVDVASNWAIRTRKDPALVGKTAETDWQGLYGIGPRFLQNTFSKTMTDSQTVDSKTVTPFTVIRMIESLIMRNPTKNAKDIPVYLKHLDEVKKEFTQQIQDDVSAAILLDKELVRSYYLKYARNLALWSDEAQRGKVDENFMRRIEKEMKPAVGEADMADFRVDLLNRINRAEEGPVVLEYALLEEDESLRQALAKVMFQDMKSQLDSVPEEQIARAMQEKLGYPHAAALQAIEHLKTPGGIL